MNGAFEQAYFRGWEGFVSVRKPAVGWSAVTGAPELCASQTLEAEDDFEGVCHG